MDHHEPILLFFRVADRPELAARYHAGQRACYTRHGAAAAVSAPGHRGVHMVAAIVGGAEVVAGMRIHERCADHPLPVELALAERCPIRAALDAREPAPVVEMSGLWVADDRPRAELAAAVTRTALAACRLLGARSVVGCAHQHILAFYRRYGAVVDETLGAHPYPSPRYATQVVFGDLVTLAGAAPGEHRGVQQVTERLQSTHQLAWAQVHC